MVELLPTPPRRRLRMVTLLAVTMPPVASHQRNKRYVCIIVLQATTGCFTCTFPSQVLDTFQAGSNSEHGFSVDEVARRLSSQGLNPTDVKRAAEFLALEGHLYATKDEAHYKTTA